MSWLRWCPCPPPRSCTRHALGTWKLKRRRHVLKEGESLSTLAHKASVQALDMAGVKAEELDLILFATSSPDDLFGSACQVITGNYCAMQPASAHAC